MEEIKHVKLKNISKNTETLKLIALLAFSDYRHSNERNKIDIFLIEWFPTR